MSPETSQECQTDGEAQPEGHNAPHTKSPRQKTMALLARAEAALLDELVSQLPVPKAHDVIRPAETGLIMARGRMGGTGQAFNLGEVSVTRCVVRLPTGEVGTSYILGRDKKHARNAALCDAFWQHPTHKTLVESLVIAPLEDAALAARDQVRAETAATRVDFFTLVRGDN